MMKIAMICHDLTVKQYHLACALSDTLGWQINFYYTKLDKINWRKTLCKLPSIYETGRYLKSQISRKAFYINFNYDPPLNNLIKYASSKVETYDPDLIYITSASEYTCEGILANHVDKSFILDVEDSKLFRGYDKRFNDMIKSELKLVENKQVKIVLWGSQAELDKAVKVYGEIGKPAILLYPLVARRTLPRKFKEKTREFSLVYLGSLWKGKNYRNQYSILKEIAETGIQTHIYLLNSWNKSNWTYLKNLASEYRNLIPHPFIPYPKAKEEITQYHAGLCGNPWDYEKTNATYGMKPLEYAYAGVTPASLGIPIKNLSDGKEFGYRTTTATIIQDYKNNLSKFDYEHHLMDNNLEELRKNIEEII